MNSTRLEQRANDFILAAERLAEACQQPFTPFIRDSVIQRFEFCWELADQVYRFLLSPGQQLFKNLARKVEEWRRVGA
jgi:hypothetical protein